MGGSREKAKDRRGEEGKNKMEVEGEANSNMGCTK